MFLHQRQESMRGPASDNLQFPQFLEFAKGADQIASVAVAERGARLLETVVIKPRQILKGFVPLGAVDLFLGQLDQLRNVQDVAFSSLSSRPIPICSMEK